MKHIIVNGTLDVTHKEQCSRSIIDVAAFRNLRVIFFRLLRLYARKYLSPLDTLKLFCVMSVGQTDNHVDHFKGLITELNEFKLADIIVNDWSILMTPLYLDNFEIFEYLLDVIAQARVDKNVYDSKEEGLKDIIDNQVEDASTIIQILVMCDHMDLALKCMQFNPEFWGEANYCDIPPEVFFEIDKKPESFNAFIIENFPKMREAHCDKDVIKYLIQNNWHVAIKQLYEKYPEVKEFLFVEPPKAILTLLNCIDKWHYEIVDFLIVEHADQLTSPTHILSLIHSCAFVAKGYNSIKLLLQLPNADPCLLASDVNHYKSPIFVSLQYHHIETYKLLLNHIKDKEKLLGILNCFFFIGFI